MTENVRVPRASLHDLLYAANSFCEDGDLLAGEICNRVKAMLAASPQGEGSSADADTHRAAEGAVVGYSGPFGLGWLTEALGNRGVEVSPGYSPAMAAIIALDHYRGALEGNPLADPSSLSATPPAEPEWITHGGGPNPVPGKMVDVRFRGSDVEDYTDHHSETWTWEYEGEDYDIIAYRVTEGVKP